MSLARGAYDQESVPHVGDEATWRYGPFIEAHIARRAHEWLTRPVDELDALLLDGRKRLHGPRARRSKLSDAGMLGSSAEHEARVSYDERHYTTWLCRNLSSPAHPIVTDR